MAKGREEMQCGPAEWRGRTRCSPNALIKSTFVPARVGCGRGCRRGGVAAAAGGFLLRRLVVDFPRQAVRYQGAAHDALLAHGGHRALGRVLRLRTPYLKSLE